MNVVVVVVAIAVVVYNLDNFRAQRTPRKPTRIIYTILPHQLIRLTYLVTIYGYNRLVWYVLFLINMHCACS